MIGLASPGRVVVAPLTPSSIEERIRSIRAARLGQPLTEIAAGACGYVPSSLTVPAGEPDLELLRAT